MRVLLISPPYYKILGFYNRYFPLGIVTLGTHLKKIGHSVTVYDADFLDDIKSIDYSKIVEKQVDYLASFNNNHYIWKDFEKTIKEFKPDVVGISCYTDYVRSTIESAKIIKKVFKNIKVFVGGPHATVKAEELMSVCSSIDYIVRGDGEETVSELLEAINQKREVSKIRGLVYRVDNKIIVNRKRESLRGKIYNDIPDRTILFNEKKYLPEDMGLIMTSRGCPYNCSFCSTDHSVSWRSVDSVIEEIKLVKSKYKTLQFTFKDDSFTVDRKRVVDLCQKIINEKLAIRWECNTRVNLVDDNLLKLMKKSGCNFIKVGVETGSENLLKKMNKGITLNQVETAAKLFRKNKIHWSAYFMIGTLDERRVDINKTIKFIEKIKPNLVIMGTYLSYPGTRMFADGVTNNFLKNSMTCDDFYNEIPNNYYKIENINKTKYISNDDFIVIEKKVYNFVHRYNKRLVNVLSMALAKMSIYIIDFGSLIADVRKFFKY